jgi:hypothetical protein
LFAQQFDLLKQTALLVFTSSVFRPKEQQEMAAAAQQQWQLELFQRQSLAAQSTRRNKYANA